MDELKRDMEARLKDAFVKEFADLNVDRVAEIGDPAETITRYAHTQGADLIMMPTHGYGPFRSLLLGSVTAKVLARFTVSGVDRHPRGRAAGAATTWPGAIFCARSTLRRRVLP